MLNLSNLFMIRTFPYGFLISGGQQLWKKVL
nr:MAG TPA: hypothetical protein [Caudoviricetes sp.]